MAQSENRGDLGPAPVVKPIVVPSDKQRRQKIKKTSEQEKVFTKVDELDKSIRVSGQPERSESPKQLLKKKPRPLPKAKPRPTVGRGAGGRIVSLKKPTPISKRKQTRTGKKIDKETGKIAVPLVKRGEGGRAVGTTPEERRATITTVLPEAGRELMQPASRPQTAQPMGTLQRGGQKVRGFVAPYPKVHAAVQAALGHIESMKATKGTPEFDGHHDTFNAIHENIKSWDPRGLGITVGQLKHSTIHGASPAVLSQLHSKIKDRLEEGRIAHEENVRRAQEGRERKKAQ